MQRLTLRRRISISVVESNVNLEQDFIYLDVFPEMTFADVKALVEGDLKISPVAQHLSYQQNMITDDRKTIQELNIQEGDMLGLTVEDPAELERRRRSHQRPGPEAARPSQRSRGGEDPETLRLQLLGNAEHLNIIRESQPELAAAVADRERFHTLWDEYQRHLARMDAEKQAFIALLNADPMNIEVQRKMEEHIRMERVHENHQKAWEESPESFARVSMLYIEVQVNNHHMKAFVDTGAQSTIMSPSAAEACGIMRLIDKRYAGIAVGVGTAEILGKVHYADVQMGPYVLDSSFTVMEGKGVEFLLGLDMMKRHQMTVDLKENVLVVKDAKIPFLPESEIPDNMEQRMDELRKMRAATTVEPKSEATIATGSEQPPAKTAKTQASASQPPAQAPSSSLPQNPGAPAASRGPRPESIAKLTNMGFSRAEAIHALDAADGNEELAIASLL